MQAWLVHPNAPSSHPPYLPPAAAPETGADILKAFDGHDATAHFYSLHSRDAVAKLKKMTPVDIKEPAPERDPVDLGGFPHLVCLADLPLSSGC